MAKKTTTKKFLDNITKIFKDVETAKEKELLEPFEEVSYEQEELSEEQKHYKSEYEKLKGEIERLEELLDVFKKELAEALVKYKIVEEEDLPF